MSKLSIKKLDSLLIRQMTLSFVSLVTCGTVAASAVPFSAASARETSKSPSTASKFSQHFGSIDVFEYAANPHHTWSMSQIEDALKKNPNDLELLADRARAYILDGNYEDATTEFSKLLARNPRFGRAYFLRSELDRGDGNTAAMYSDLKKAQQYGPTGISLAATERLALYYRKDGKFAESTAEYDKLIASGQLTQRMLGQITYQRSEIYFLTNHPEQGIEGAKAAIKLDPNLSIAYMGIARTYRNMNKLQDALDNYNHVIDFESTHSRRFSSDLILDAYKERAEIFAKLGRKDLARRDLVTAKQYERETVRTMPFQMR